MLNNNSMTDKLNDVFIIAHRFSKRSCIKIIWVVLNCKYQRIKLPYEFNLNMLRSI